MRIAAGEPTSEIFSAIIAGVEAAHPGVLCSILLLRDGCQIASAAAPSLPAFYSQAIDGVLVGPKAGSCGTAMYRGERVIVEDIANDPLWADYKDLAAQAGLASCWSEPIIGADGRPLGAFAMYQRRPARPDERDMGAIAAAAHLAAITLDRDAARGALAESEARARKAAAAERASMEEVEMFFDVSTDLLCISNLAGEIQRVNRAWTRMLGHAPEAVVGQDFRTLLHPDDIEPTRERVRGLGSTADEITITNRYRCADGSYRPIEWRARLSGERLFGIGRDVTEREAAQAAMKRAQEAAEAANRAKSDFLANMSHEVRTPLNGVIGILGALAHTELTPQQREMVDLIQASGATLERLVSDILDISKIEAGRLELEASDFDLEAALDSVLEVARIRCDDKGVAFRVERGPTARGRFIGDAVRIKQILDNLLSNAVKFTRAGEISVTVGVVEPAEMTGSAELMLSVSDTGIGFDPAMAESLFDRFSQADGAITRRFGGTGLGLSICKALTEMMDGRIEAQSVPGEGSRFSFRAPLPRAMPLQDYDQAQAVAAGEAAPGQASVRDTGPLRVLLAEDNPTNQKVVSLILGPVGAEVTVAENGAEALEAFRTGAFDLVLMDLQMPVMDGLAATRAIRALEAAEPGRPRTPIAVLSANAMAHHRDEALEAGADLHIAKPVTPRGLIEGVERALAAG
ncbi:response regulator [Phenylobacterium montanum]|uniref:Sensory/regulatory protein RpfC n=2 Tax=Phenylobacterium montanum TaxID=2823693 RepID=A0A975G476_9CAUL|nr:response regulator [Caulobacter sp. S6]